ncbi:Adenylyl cyclase-associated protein 1 [Fragariocoptes setiger]|uniref:Adenylyl cyclase-associated protein 1 n=1 Tax=Fragariocoptes setiger TaxID=1670756 RepID=A0ABQ7SBM7_9ACAR|nr:Adenylyl cyclase-associated protein 1 [Fragariocoptes setiger]
MPSSVHSVSGRSITSIASALSTRSRKSAAASQRLRVKWWQRSPILKTAYFLDIQKGSYTAAIFTLDLFFTYHQVMFLLWFTLTPINVFAWLVVYSNYQELCETTKLEDIAHLKMSTINSLQGSRTLSQMSHQSLDSSYRHYGPTINSNPSPSYMHRHSNLISQPRGIYSGGSIASTPTPSIRGLPHHGSTPSLRGGTTYTIPLEMFDLNRAGSVASSTNRIDTEFNIRKKTLHNQSSTSASSISTLSNLKLPNSLSSTNLPILWVPTMTIPLATMEEVQASFEEYLQRSQMIGDVVQQQSVMVADALKLHWQFVSMASECKRPAQNELINLLKPLGQQIQAIQDFRQKNRTHELFNHLSAISEGAPALGWMSVSPTPGPYVKDMTEASQFYTNKVLVAYKDKDKRHVDWVSAWLKFLDELRQFIKKAHTTGLTWNVRGRDVSQSGGGLPPPPPPMMPPPPPATDLGVGGDQNDARTALLKQLNQGTDITKNLRHVSKDGRSLRTPVSDRSSRSKSPDPRTVSTIKRTPKFEFEGKKWVLEYHDGSIQEQFNIQATEMNQSVNIYKCERVMVVVSGKINSITVDSCKKLSLVFDDIVSVVEFINCQGIQAQPMAKVPTITIDKTDGIQLFLRKSSLDVELVSAKSAEINVCVVDEATGDYKEYAIPEQLKSAPYTVSTNTMGAFLDKPRTEKSSEQGGGLGLRYGVCSMQGWRTEMEDAHSSRIGLPLGFDDWSFFTVFDGHAGKKVSALAADNLIKSIFVEGVYPHDVDPASPSMEPDGWKKVCDDYKLQYPFDSETEGKLVRHFEEHGDDYHRYEKDPKQRSYEVGEVVNFVASKIIDVPHPDHLVIAAPTTLSLATVLDVQLYNRVGTFLPCNVVVEFANRRDPTLLLLLTLPLLLSPSPPFEENRSEFFPASGSIIRLYNARIFSDSSFCLRTKVFSRSEAALLLASIVNNCLRVAMASSYSCKPSRIYPAAELYASMAFTYSWRACQKLPRSFLRLACSRRSMRLNFGKYSSTYKSCGYFCFNVIKQSSLVYGGIAGGFPVCPYVNRGSNMNCDVSPMFINGMAKLTAGNMSASVVTAPYTVSTNTMGAFLDKPRTEKSSEQGGGLGLRYGVCSMQGWRTEMEDAHSSRIGLPLGFDDWSFFTVFDGHAGKKVSALAADNLIKSIFVEGVCDDYKLQYPFDSETEGKLVRHFEEHGDDYHRYKKDPKQRSYEVGEDGCECLGPRHPEFNQTSLTFLRALGWYLPSEEDSVWMVKEAIRRGFLSLDDRLRDLPDIREGQDRSGSTAVCAIISPEHIYLANCGDSRAIMCRDYEVIFETQDHKPADSRERKRIVEAGGTVMIQRVNGSLAVSRALGDYEYKNNQDLGPCKQLVSPEPDVHAFQRRVKREKEFSRDGSRCKLPQTVDPDFIVLACDGIWDVMSSDEVCKFVTYLLKVHDDLEYICATVIDTCLHKGSRDNMTLVIVVFPRGPKKSEVWAAEDRELDNTIVEYLTETKPFDLPWSGLVHHIIARVGYNRLPPGGGIESKFRLIEETLLKLKPRPDSQDPQATKSDDERPETQDNDTEATTKPTEQKEGGEEEKKEKEKEDKEDKKEEEEKEIEKEKESTPDMVADISQSKR